MERRLAITYIVSATTTFGIACVAIATASGGLFANAAPKNNDGKQVEIVDDYIVVHSSTTVLAADSAEATASAPSPKSALRGLPLPLVAGTPAPAAEAPAPAVAPAEAVTADAPLSQTPPNAAPVSAEVPDEARAPAPAPAPESDEPDPAPAPAHTSEPPASASGPAARPPIPPGCHDPEFRHGTWKCDDD